MDRQRRAVLGGVGAGIGLVLAGCLGSAREDPQSARSERSDVAVESETVPQTATSGQPTANDRVGATTDQIMDELAWFADEYHPAIDAYREAGEDVLDVVVDVGESVPLTERDVHRLDGRIDRPRSDRGWPYDIWWDDQERLWRHLPIDWQTPDEASDDPEEDHTERPPIEGADVEQLRERTAAFAGTFEEELEPHFRGAKKERQFAEETIDTIEEFAARRDTAMVVAGLVRLYRHYDTLISRRYINEHLSANPIRNRLNDYLRAPDADQAEFPPLFELEYRGKRRETHRAFAYSRDVSEARRSDLLDGEALGSIDGATAERDPITLQDAVGALEVEDDRNDRAYFVVNVWRRRAGRYYSQALRSEPIFVQRYQTRSAAQRALEALDDDDRMTIEPLGGSQWAQIAFPFQGETWYAQLQVAGRHLLVRGVARRPLEHRIEGITGEEWTEPLRLSWVWTD